MTNPYRAMCAELVDVIEQTEANRQHGLPLRIVTERLDRARALLAQPVAEGPSDEELDLLVIAIQALAPHQPDATTHNLASVDRGREILNEALARWGRPAAAPVPVSERLPGPGVKVLAYYFNALGNGRTICAIWVPAKSRSDEGDLDANDFLEYDEECDKYYWPEGWYEAIENWDELGWAKVYEGEIVYWQPLPKWPANAHALPTPEDTND